MQLKALRQWISARETGFVNHVAKIKAAQKLCAEQLAVVLQFYSGASNVNAANAQSALELFVRYVEQLRQLATLSEADVLGTAGATPTAAAHAAAKPIVDALLEQHRVATTTLARVRSWQREFESVGDKCPSDEPVLALLDKADDDREALKKAHRALEDAKDNSNRLERSMRRGSSVSSDMTQVVEFKVACVCVLILSDFYYFVVVCL